MQKLYKAWSALLEHARTGRLSLFGRPVDDILGMQKPAGGIEKIRADLSFGDFEALRHDRGFDLLRVSIAEVRSLMTPVSGRQPKPQQVCDLIAGDPNRFSESLPYKRRISEIQEAYLATHGEEVSETSIKKGLRRLPGRRAPPHMSQHSTARPIVPRTSPAAA